MTSFSNSSNLRACESDDDNDNNLDESDDESKREKQSDLKKMCKFC